MNINRRAFLKYGIIGAGGLSATGLYGLDFNTNEVERTEISIALTNLPPAFNGYRIGFLTDLHLGKYLSNEVIERSVSLINQSEVDLIVLGGDYLWVPESLTASSYPLVRNPSFEGLDPSIAPTKIMNVLAEILSDLRSSDGVIAVLGNHDRWVAPDVALSTLGRIEVLCLVNESFVVTRSNAKLTVVGVDDYWTGIPMLSAPLQKSPVEVRILLSHNPDYVSYVLANTKFEMDLALCGHTHGGQIKLPGIGALKYNVRDHRFAEGLCTEARAPVYTSRGIGVVEVPLRVNCPPEVSVITLTDGGTPVQT